MCDSKTSPQTQKEITAKRETQGSKVVRSHYTWNLLQVETGHQVLRLFPDSPMPFSC